MKFYLYAIIITLLCTYIVLYFMEDAIYKQFELQENKIIKLEGQLKNQYNEITQLTKRYAEVYDLFLAQGIQIYDIKTRANLFLFEELETEQQLKEKHNN